MKNILKLLAILFLVSACNKELEEYELPYELSPTAQLSTDVSNLACPNMSFTIDSDESSVIYVIMPSQVEAPTSDEIFLDQIERLLSDGITLVTYPVEFLDFDTAGSLDVSLSGLTAATDYTIYAVTINENGTRSGEVFTSSFSIPSGTETANNMIGTAYEGFPTAFGASAPQFDVTLTPSGALEYSTASLWGPNFVAWAAGDPSYNGAFPYPGTITVSDDLSVIVASTETYATGGTGYFDPCTNSFHLTLTQAVFADDFTVDVVISAGE